MWQEAPMFVAVRSAVLEKHKTIDAYFETKFPAKDNCICNFVFQ